MPADGRRVHDGGLVLKTKTFWRHTGHRLGSVAIHTVPFLNLRRNSN